MTTIRPRTPCVVRSRTSTTDRFGREEVSEKRTKTKCAIISLYDSSDKTTVRADSSASRGRADERLADARLLFRPNESLKLGDVVEFETGGEKVVVEITRIFRRPDVGGRIHHIDVEGERWASE